MNAPTLISVQRQRPIGEWVLYAALLLYPALTLTVRGGVNGAMAVITLVSIYMLAASGKKARERIVDLEAKLFAVAMSSGAFAILINQIYYQHFDARPFDSELRFLLAIFIFVALRPHADRVAAVLEYAFPVGVLATFIILNFVVAFHSRLRADFLDAIHAAEIAVALAFLSLYSINWLRKDRKFLLLLKLGAFLAGISIAIQTGTRGVWVALPVLVLLWYASLARRPFSIKLMLGIIAGLCLFAYSALNIVHKRVDLAVDNLAAYSKGKGNNGTAARIELWKASLRLLRENPVVGIEHNSLVQEMTRMRDAGLINDLTLREATAEMHSELAARMAKYGMLGLLGALAVIFAPLWMFYRRMGASNHVVAVAAKMGVGFVVGFFIFGLTVEVFNIKMVAAFYALTMAVLLALAYRSAPETDYR